MEETPGDIHLHMSTIYQDHMMYGSWSIRCKTQRFFVVLVPFCPFPHLRTWKLKFWKNVWSSWSYYHFTLAYRKGQSNHVCFLRYGVRQTECFVILDHFLLFYPLTSRKMKILKKWKMTYDPFAKVYQKWKS